MEPIRARTYAAALLLVVSCSDRRNTEAKKFLGPDHVNGLAEKTVAYYAKNKRLPPPATATPAEGSCCGQPRDQCQPNAASWNVSPWRDIGFKIDKPTYAWVSLEVTDSGFTARAHGDIDCDTNYSTFEVTGETSAAA